MAAGRTLRRAERPVVNVSAWSRGMPIPFRQATLHFSPLKDSMLVVKLGLHGRVIWSFGDQGPDNGAGSAGWDVSSGHNSCE
jgi:hypothetical protein